jgi:acetyl-CoA carboxylase biotin carboxyl carrier protein
MDLRKLKTLIDLVQNSGISELEISEGEEKIRIAKHLTARRRHHDGEHARQHAPLRPACRAAPAPTPAPAGTGGRKPEGHVVTAPMVGHLLPSGSPGAPLRRGRQRRQGRARRCASSKP